MSKYKEINISKVRTIRIANRRSKVVTQDFAEIHQKNSSFRTFWNSLPNILKGGELKELTGKIATAVEKNKPVIWMMGAHVIKCGLSPLVIDLIRRNVVTAVAVNGAGAIHDVETAYWGQTSEDVAENLKDGTFGMSEDTAKILNETISLSTEPDSGFGEILGKKILSDRPGFWRYSLLANAYQNNVPVTVHVGVGTDIVHQHKNADGAAIGARSIRDFRILAEVISKLNDGGVVLNFGSTVILPEVFLKALTVARNVGNRVENFYTANFDMIQHYRPRVNVVQRPTMESGKGYQFTGHHELLIPLLAAALIELLD